MIDKTIVRKKTGANCHQSDTSPVPSSLRSFEFYTFCDYLKKEENADKVFEDYLEIKGRYHGQMADFWRNFSNTSSFPEVAEDISSKELVHSRLLRKDKEGKIPADIKKAEAKKIQMSNFMHEQSQFADVGRINPEQLQNYTDETVEFFEKSLEKAKEANDKDRGVYFGDCLEIMSSWKHVNETLAQKIEEKDPNTMKKLTQEKILTLDDVMNFAG